MVIYLSEAEENRVHVGVMNVSISYEFTFTKKIKILIELYTVWCLLLDYEERNTCSFSRNGKADNVIVLQKGDPLEMA